MNRYLFGTAFLLVCCTGSALAQEYRSREVAGWLVAEANDGAACLMSMDFEGDGETNILFSLAMDGSNRLMIDNYNWSLKKDEELELDFYLTAGSYKEHQVVGYEHKGRHGFITRFEIKFTDYFAASKSLLIRRGDVVVDQLSLSGSGAAVAEMRRCVSVIKARADAEAREKAKWAHIPKDPFGSTGTERKP